MFSLLVKIDRLIQHFFRYYIVYVFEGAGLTGRRSNLIADVSHALFYNLP